MFYWPTVQDMLATLPPGEQAELLALVVEHTDPDPEPAEGTAS